MVSKAASGIFSASLDMSEPISQTVSTCPLEIAGRAWLVISFHGVKFMLQLHTHLLTSLRGPCVSTTRWQVCRTAAGWLAG
jgi:hypothetical protein